MAIFRFDEDFPYVLQVLDPDHVYKNVEIRDQVAQLTGATQEDREMMLESKRNTVFDSRVNWAITYLRHAGLVQSDRRGVQTLVELNGLREHVRTGETHLGNLITDAMLELSGADVALTNGGGIRDSIVAGPVTTGDVLRVLPFNNTLIVIEVSGQDILDALTFGVSDYPDPQGKLPHVAGLSFFILTDDAGNQVHQVMVGDAPLDLEATYSLATNDFMAVGGDGYDMFAGSTQLALYGDLAEVVNEYINAHSPVAPEVEGRITAGDELPADDDADAGDDAAGADTGDGDSDAGVGDDDDAVAEIPKTGEFESGSVYFGAGLLAVAGVLLVLRKKHTKQDAA